MFEYFLNRNWAGIGFYSYAMKSVIIYRLICLNVLIIDSIYIPMIMSLIYYFSHKDFFSHIL